MSLYNNTRELLASGNLLGSVRSGISDAVGSAATAALGGGALASAVGAMGGSAADGEFTSALNRALSQQQQSYLNLGAGAVGDLMSGDWNAAGLRLLGSGLLPGLMGDAASQARYMATPSPLLGGITPMEAKRIQDELRGANLARKNLFLIQAVSSRVGGDIAKRFNLFATELDYAPFTINGEDRKIGATTAGCVTGSEPVTLRITTMDDNIGTIKRWFEIHFSAVSAKDGTVGLPANYAVKFKILHAFITDSSNRVGYTDIGLFMPANLDVSLSRRDSAMAELQMTFKQIDPFMVVT